MARRDDIERALDCIRDAETVLLTLVDEDYELHDEVGVDLCRVTDLAGRLVGDLEDLLA